MAEIENMTLTLSKYDTEYMTEVNTNVAILQTIVCMVVLPIGLSLVFGIVLYECQGVDSQKRSIFNQLISATFITLGTTGLTVLVPITIRCWTGPLGHILGMIVSITRRFLFTFFSILVADILIYKNLCILKPNWILKLNDDFWVTFWIVWNAILALGCSNMIWYASSAHPRVYFFISGCRDLTSAIEDRKMFVALWSIIIGLAIFYMLTRLIKKPFKEPQQESQKVFNNNAHNPALINNLQILFVVFMFVLVAIPGLYVTNQGPNGFILGSLPGVIVALMVVPMLFYAFNTNLRKFVVKEVKEVLWMNSNEVENIESNSNQHIERF